MTLVFLLAPAIGFLLLAAHFYRAGLFAAMAVALVMIALVGVRRPWAARAMQAALVVGAIEWLRSAVTLSLARSAQGEPYLRLTIILGGVAVFTALCALVVQTSRLREHFRLGPDADRHDG